MLLSDSHSSRQLCATVKQTPQLDDSCVFPLSVEAVLCAQLPPTSTDSLAAIMMATKRLDNFEVVCEWDSCGFTGHNMVELSDHMSLHLMDYVGDNDALEELGE